jgi:hypothetical protein
VHYDHLGSLVKTLYLLVTKIHREVVFVSRVEFPVTKFHREVVYLLRPEFQEHHVCWLDYFDLRKGKQIISYTTYRNTIL